jgi:enterochelin esterase-like enzyme
MGVSRRQFLVGGAAAGAGVGALGLAGFETHRGRRALHTLGVVESPDHPIPNVKVRVERGTLSNGRRYRIAQTGDRPTVAIVCLHGRNNDEGYAFDAIGVHRFARAAGMAAVVASIDGGDASYWHRRRNSDDPMRDLTDELVPILDRRAGESIPRAVLGWSMGGYGALLAAATRPELFATAVASSPAVWRRAADTPEGAFDDAADFERNDILDRLDRLRDTRVRIDCGADDPFAAIVRRLHTDLPQAAGGITPGFHDPSYWRSVLPAQLRFIAGTTDR